MISTTRDQGEHIVEQRHFEGKPSVHAPPVFWLLSSLHMDSQE
jgi:hypothetical protein